MSELLPERWRGLPTTRVPFGLRDGRLWYVHDVEPGIACRCVCPDPACGLPLVAKNIPSEGRRRAYHFVHATEPSGCTGRETALHLMAKQILAQPGQLTLPPWRSAAGTFGPYVCTVDGGEAERAVPYTDLRPDLRLSVRGPSGAPFELYVEIRVTHAVGDSKTAVLREAGTTAVEIDLSRITEPELVDARAFAELLRDKVGTKHWLALTNGPALSALLGREVFEVTSQETHQSEVKTANATWYYARQGVRVFHPEQSPRDTSIELHDSRNAAGERIDPYKIAVPYASGFYVSVPWTDFRDRYKTTLRSIAPWPEEPQVALF
jgi:hypothetical protein